MKKKHIVFIILITAIIVWTADLLAGNYLSARLATSSFARKYNLFNPQAPIVVTNRETVRVNNSTDVVQTAENAKSKISSLVYYDNTRLVNTGTAINWTSDGYFITTKAAFAPAGKVFAVITLSGDVFPVEASYVDPASNLVILKTSAQGLGVLDPANSSELRVGQQVVGLENPVGNKQTRFITGFVQRIPSDTFGIVSESDLVSRITQVQVAGSENSFSPGSVILNLSGRMIGVWDGQAVVNVEDVQLLVNNFLSDQKRIVRPSLGFSYQLLSDSESKILQTVSGARVMGIAPGKSAASAGLKAGDVITDWDGKKINIDTDFDGILRATKPNQVIRVSVSRGGQW
jgi:serine protease Do